MFSYKNLGNNLKVALIRTGISRADLSSKTGINIRNIGQYCNGIRVPTIKGLCDICEALGYTPNELLGGEDDA